MDANRKTKLYLSVILTVSVLLRMTVALYLGNVVDAPPLLTDQRSYHALGARLVGGHGFSFDHAWYPFTPENTPTAHWSFLYSLFIAGIYALFGANPLAARLIQGILGGLLLPWMVYRLSGTLFLSPLRSLSGEGISEAEGQAIPLVGAGAAACYGYFILHASTLMTETFYIVALLWTLEVGIRIADRLRGGQPIPRALAWQLGLGLGLAALLRQSILPWIPVLFAYLLWLAWRNQQITVLIPTVLRVGVILALLILPWTYRNYRVYGTFLLLNSNTGYAMYSAQHPMHGTRFREFDAAPVPEGLSWPNEARMDRELMRLGIQFVLQDPGRYLLLSLSRVRAFFEFWPTPDTSLLHNIGRTGSFGLFLPLIVYGLYRSFKSPKFFSYSALLMLFSLFYTLLHIFTWAMVRYRLPVDAVLMPWVGLAVVDLAHRTQWAPWCADLLKGNVRRSRSARVYPRVKD